MTLTISPPSHTAHRTVSQGKSSPAPRTMRTPRRAGHSTLGRYVDSQGRAREVLARPGSVGSVLVVDRDVATLGDRRLVAHLAADEPRENASVVCRCYLADVRGRWCRSVKAEDLEGVSCAEGERAEQALGTGSFTAGTVKSLEVGSYAYRLEPLSTDMSIPELRWHRYLLNGDAMDTPEPISVREVIARTEDYEPVCTLTLRACSGHRHDPSVSVVVLRAELERVHASSIVLNRGLRQAVLAAMQAQNLSMSEIAIRCGRVKRDGRGNMSGETSWLARRLGILPEGGKNAPTPWVHSEVLGLIARCGLGISPREVELG
jgi:hypothetical protein